MFWLYLTIYLISQLIGWFITAFGISGTWIMALASILYVWLGPSEGVAAAGWWLVVTQLLLAGLAELLESLAGLAGSAKAGASKRAMALGLLFSIAGAIFGFSLGNLVIPLIGGLLGSILVAALGSLGGTVLGELWKGRTLKDTMPAGWSAFFGRVLGTVAKTTLATIMLVLAIAALTL